MLLDGLQTLNWRAVHTGGEDVQSNKRHHGILLMPKEGLRMIQSVLSKRSTGVTICVHHLSRHRTGILSTENHKGRALDVLSRHGCVIEAWMCYRGMDVL